jgi:dienelactone hydrolase
MRTPIAVVLLVLLLVAAVAPAAEPGPGKMAMVTCKANPEQRYSCYVPKAYTPKKAWPILYCFSPNANGDAFVQRYRNVCEERGWIVVGSMNSRNGPWEPIKAAIDAMWKDTEERFHLSKKMRYASGFSGGARVSFGLAEMKPDFFAGVIAIGAGLSSTNRGLPRKELRIWLMCGQTDFNLNELQQLHPRLKDNGNPVEFKTFPGAHVMPPVSLMEDAVRFMDDGAAEKQHARLRAAIDEAAKLRDDGEPAKAWLVIVEAMERYAGVKELQGEAKKLRKALERMSEVKAESKALAAYDKAAAWVEKNRARIEKHDAVKSQAEKKLRKVIESYPGTRGAERAEKKLEELGG